MGTSPRTGDQFRQPFQAGVNGLDHRHRYRTPQILGTRGQPAVPGPAPLEVGRECRRQCEHPQGVRGRCAIDDQIVPPAGLREVGDRTQPEHLLYPRYRRKLFGSNGVQIRSRESRGQHRRGRTPGRLKQHEGVQSHGVEVPATGIATLLLGEDADRLGAAAGLDRDTEDITEGVGLVGRDQQYPLTVQRRLDPGRGRQRGLSHPALTDEETDAGPTGRGPQRQPHRVVTDVLDAPLEVFERGLGQSALRLALEQTDHGDQSDPPRVHR